MQRYPDELNLKESYQFKVTIENNGTHFVGELSLTPKECTLIIRGDISEDRQPAFNMAGLDELTCDCFGSTLLLFCLKGKGASSQSIERYPKLISHFEIEYSISHVMYCRATLSRDIGFLEVELDSPSIAQWVGYTHIQDDIVRRHNDGTLFPYSGALPTEFEQTLSDLGVLRVRYYPSTHYSVETFSMGLRFPPVLSLSFDDKKTGDQIIENLGEIDTLFSFLIGRPLDLNTVKLTTAHGRMHRLSLYFSRSSSNTEDRGYPWFPLGINLRIDHMGLPEFPLDSFAKYFGLPPGERMYFKKYIKYCEMQSPEERFLGFFRLLEKLCFQKESFLPESKLATLVERAKPFLIKHFGDKKNVERILGRMIDLNNSKLNTAGCIVRLIKKIPSDLLNRWIYGPSNINEICKLRNDLTHANEIEPEEYEIERKAKFIETLLVICLLNKIGIPIDSGALIAPRIKSHQLIEKPPKITYSTREGN